ncbi:TPA: GNAT family N-acetyltransferase [Streptococcus pneumoniae]|jgi:Acetyltransferases|uniref:Acetyltransferase, GNAT family n=2 Tax=Streptococcus pneumoniae TaxID=1313 RepID=A0A0H2UND0_STRPN|nr:GNAT family N-acetyltransferase [Streptococcus pneumoniae]EHD83022.1 acetyltransferase, GNAT family [Streptococcus pneumoniae GA07643]EJG76559.1 acetyltransferase family protein [Streptococcus pneumoniae 2082170]EJG81460.1 acetyltransferase, GNAT family [Streptococcus pneumoniae SPAR48]AAK74435.1 acetyltransferase, GNAT family [Streptococcus pneumoniae TIGR4]AUF84152.1 N-acetyltransferase [Streptococcus pneumoniae]
MITIKKQEIVKLEDVLHLYQAVGWTNYTHQTEMLEQALSHSLVIYLALDGDAVVGLIRLVGDGFSSVFVQDLIVLPSYQRQGIGSSLMKEALGNFKEAYQVQLATEETEKNVGFYRSMGFEILSTYDCTGMIWINREK